MSWLADGARGRTVPIVLLLLLALMAGYARYALNTQAGWRWCLDAPAARDGSTLVFPLWTVTAVDGATRYHISKNVKDIPVEGDSDGLRVGDTVSVVARFDAGRTLAVETSRELHVLRRWKEGLGVLGFVCVVLAAPFAFRVVRTPAGRRLETRWPT